MRQFQENIYTTVDKYLRIFSHTHKNIGTSIIYLSAYSH